MHKDKNQKTISQEITEEFLTCNNKDAGLKEIGIFIALSMGHIGMAKKMVEIGEKDYKLILDNVDNAANIIYTLKHSDWVDKKYQGIIDGAGTVIAHYYAVVCSLSLDSAKNQKNRLTKTYFLKNKATGLIKIGRSINVPGRIKSLQTGSGQELELIHTIDDDVENELHMLFADLRVFGEWFCDNGEIKNFINKT